MFIRFSGNLVANAVKKMVGEKEVLSFRVIADNASGSKKAPVGVDCSIWGAKRIAAAETALKTGVAVELCGEQEVRLYKDKDEKSAYGINFEVSSGEILTFSGKGVKPTKTPLFPKSEEAAAE